MPQVLLGEWLALGDHGLLVCPGLLVGVDALGDHSLLDCLGLLVGVDALRDHGLLDCTGLLVGDDTSTLKGMGCLSCVHASLHTVLCHHLDNSVG